MPERGRRYAACIMLLVIFALAAGCGDKDLAEVETMSFEQYYLQEKSEICVPEQVVCGAECAWVITTGKNDVIYQVAYGNESPEVKEITWQQDEAEHLISIAYENGKLYAMVRMDEGKTLEIRYYRLDGEFETYRAIEAEAEQGLAVGTLFWVDAEENVYIAEGNAVTRFDAGTGEKTEVTLNGTPCVFLETENGVECLVEESDGIGLYGIEGKNVQKRWKIKKAVRNLKAVRNSDAETLFLVSESALMLVDRATGTLLAETDLLLMGAHDVLAGNYETEDSTLWLFQKGNGTEGRLEISQFERKEAGTEERRIQLVYGTMGTINEDADDSIKAVIMQFNQENKNYYITIKNYHDDVDLRRLHAEFASGNAPDILDLTYSFYYESYVQNGYLTDLRPYLGRSDYKDDIIWNVLDTYQIDGGLYLLAPQFSITAMAVHTEYAAEIETWNMQTFRTLLEENQWEKDVWQGYGEAERLLYKMLTGRQSEFIDRENETAAFETEEFMKLLELCKSYQESYREDAYEWTSEDLIQNELCMPLIFEDVGTYLSGTEFYGREYALYGYPTEQGQVYGVDVCPDCCGIYAGSPNKEGAWEFIESLLEESHQKWHTGVNKGFPIRKSLLREVQEEWQPITFSNGEKVSMTEAEYEILETIIYEENLVRDTIDKNVWNVIEEEAASYFAGDKSVEEAAGLIQRRIELILSE